MSHADPPIDILDDILKTFSLESSILHFSLLTAPWGIGLAPREREAADAGFYIVTEGECFLRLETEKNAPLIRLSSGDFALISQGDAHSLRDSPTSRVCPLEDWLPRVTYDEKGTVLFGEQGGGAQARILCGTVRFSGGVMNPLLDSLPPLVIVRGENDREVEWLEGTMAFLMCESRSQRPAAPTVIARMCDILFIQAIRSLLKSSTVCNGAEAPPPGWLNAVRDPDIRRAISAIHASPAHPWTVETLAREAALSRSTFAARFTQLMGEPPLRYLTRWRMHRAAVALRRTNHPIGEIALEAGYDSEAAFSKTFKRQIGIAPGAYRRYATDK